LNQRAKSQSWEVPERGNAKFAFVECHAIPDARRRIVLKFTSRVGVLTVRFSSDDILFAYGATANIAK
jgi:hypothetical protein